MAIFREEYLLPIDGLALALALVLDCFVDVGFPYIDLLIVFLIGVSVVLNLFGLYKMSRKRV